MSGKSITPREKEEGGEGFVPVIHLLPAHCSPGKEEIGNPLGENGDGNTNKTIVQKEENKEYFFITVNAIERRACEKSRIKVMAWLKYSDLIVMEEQMRGENTMIAMVCTGLPSFCLSRQIWPPTIANL